MRVTQFESGGVRTWGEYVEAEQICLDFGRASGRPDLRSYLQAPGPLPSLEELREVCLDSGYCSDAARVAFRAPVDPGVIFGVGRNFGGTAGARQRRPVLFLKAPQTVIGPDAPIVLPEDLSEVVAEVELGVVAGRDGAVFGVTIVNDVTARGIDDEDIWFYRKSLTSFTPVGPWIVTGDTDVATHNRKLRLDIDGATCVTGATGRMTFGAKAVMEVISAQLPLRPGDLISMGCPTVSPPLRPGQCVRAEIEGIGVLENRVARKGQ